ncbi:hypothetical protein [Neorhizobium sp. NCHU2750]|uniref:hypothetical protein n=1 Tax=Neorhizobium sp. NCHU2750 TaxID=1825976 RepID=UPI0013C4A9CB
MASSISISAPNSLILISGGNGSVPNRFEEGKAVAATPTMIAVGTLSEFDGPTRITLVRGRAAIGELRELFDGNLQELKGKLVVQTCEGAVILSGQFDYPQARIQVFSNDQSEPDDIVIIYS